MRILPVHFFRVVAGLFLFAFFSKGSFFDPVSSADVSAPVAGGSARFAFEEVGEVEGAFETDRLGDGF